MAAVWKTDLQLCKSTKETSQEAITIIQSEDNGSVDRVFHFGGKSVKGMGAWVAQSVKPPTLSFSSGHDLMVHGYKTCTGLPAQRGACLEDSLPVPLPSLLTYSHSQINTILRN